MLHVNYYLDYCRFVRHYSEETIKTYAYVFDTFSSFSDVEDDKVTSSLIVQYLLSLGEKSLSGATINLHRAALMSYFRFCCQFYGLVSNPVAPVAAVRKVPKLFGCITGEEMAKVLSSMPARTDLEIRDRLILTILYHCGLRVSELCNLRFADCDFDKCYFTIHGKGGKVRIVPFSDEVRSMLTYSKYRDSCYDYVISTCQGCGALTTEQVRYIVKKNLIPFVRPDKAHPHALRHAFATTLLNGGMGIESISKLMGHASVSTTMIYLSLSLDRITNIYHKIF